MKLKLGKEKVQGLIFKHSILRLTPNLLSLPFHSTSWSLSPFTRARAATFSTFCFQGLTSLVYLRRSVPTVKARLSAWDPSSALLPFSLFANPLTACLLLFFSFFFFLSLLISYSQPTLPQTCSLSLSPSYQLLLLPTITTVSSEPAGGERGKSLYAGLRTSFSTIPSESQKSIIIPITLFRQPTAPFHLKEEI